MWVLASGHRARSRLDEREGARADMVRRPMAHPEDAPRSLAPPLWLVVAAVLVPRLAVYAFTENVYGDSVIRTELGMRWAADPHFIRSWQDGPFQFGPLHVYLTGIAYWLWPVKEHAARVVSLLLGLGSAFPLFFLTRRLFDRRAALFAVLGFGLWGMHWNLSTTAASEALGLFTVLACLAALARAFDTRETWALAGAAVALQAACATRYDSWLLLPLLALLVWQRLGFATAFRFGLFCLPFPLFWLWGNLHFTGDALGPIRDISGFHKAWVADGVSRYGSLGARLIGLGFWPGAALFTLSPLLSALGFAGMARAFKARPEVRWVLWVALLPTAYFAFRMAVLQDFVPLARFTVNQLVLVLPFCALGFDAVSAELSRRGRTGAVRRDLRARARAAALADRLHLRSRGEVRGRAPPGEPGHPEPAQRARRRELRSPRSRPRRERCSSTSTRTTSTSSSRSRPASPTSACSATATGPEEYVPPAPEVKWVVLSDGGSLARSPGFVREGAEIGWGSARFAPRGAPLPPFQLFERVALKSRVGNDSERGSAAPR